MPKEVLGVPWRSAAWHGASTMTLGGGHLYRIMLMGQRLVGFWLDFALITGCGEHQKLMCCLNLAVSHTQTCCIPYTNVQRFYKDNPSALQNGERIMRR